MTRILGFIFGTTFAAVAVVGLSLIGAIEVPSNASAQEDAQLRRIVDLLIRKGFKDTPGGQFCDRFQIRGRVSDGKCAFVSLEADDDDLRGKDYPKGWYPTIEAYVEKESGLTRVFFVTLQHKPGASGSAFLTDVSGNLQKAVSGRKINGVWQWSAVGVDSNLRAIFAREVTFWRGEQKSIENLPDRKD